MTTDAFYDLMAENIGYCVEHLHQIAIAADAILIVACGMALYLLFWRRR